MKNQKRENRIHVGMGIYLEEFVQKTPTGFAYKDYKIVNEWVEE